MPLHLDYRPQSFEDFVGNKPTITSLQSLLDRDRKEVPHVFLLQGPSGCGKTTLARIIRNVLGCSDIDYKEINTSNNRGIDTAREILSTVSYKPISGGVRMYLLDEVHQATKDFQNALLKILEDTPSHAYFILCTTDPGKILPTIKNRCSTFSVSKLLPNRIVGLLKAVLTKESKSIDIRILKHIADKSDGSPRRALVMLDQIIDLDVSNPSQIEKIISKAEEQEKQVIDLCRALLDKSKWAKISTLLKGIDQEPESTRLAVLGYFNSVLLGGENTRAALVLDCFLERPFHYTGKAGLTYACYQVVMD